MSRGGGMDGVLNRIVRVGVVMLGVLVGAVSGGFISFFAILSLRLAGIIEMQEFATMPDYFVLVLCIVAGAIYGGTVVWRGLQGE